MKIDGSQPIARFAADLPGAIAIFESLGLEYACAGDRSLDDAAHAEGIAPEIVIARLRRLKAVDHATDWNNRSLADLTRHLTSQHHRLLRDELATTALRLADICTSPVHPPPDLISLRSAFARLSEIVLPHMHREEENVFPAIVALESAWQSSEPPGATRVDPSSELHHLAAEHGSISAQLRTMRELRLQLEQSSELPDRCSPLLDAIEILEAHLHEYMFLENCVLFPRASALEAQLALAAANGRQ